jgi:tungstate transport system substrate-binding protein
MGLNISLRRALIAVLAAAGLATGGVAGAQERFIVMVSTTSTTSTEQLGLFGHLLPLLKRVSGMGARVVYVGTGQALDTARRGDAEVVFVHDAMAEERFVADGFSRKRWPAMVNDFVLIGPAADPARAWGVDIAAALGKLAATGAVFISRGDKSGTHAAELRLWKLASVNPSAARPASYRECGNGIGPALHMASSTSAYVPADRGTWLSFKNRGELKVLVESARTLFNQYGVMVVDAARYPHAKQALAQTFVDWVTSPAGQAAIAAYKIGGEKFFFPNAVRR